MADEQAAKRRGWSGDHDRHVAAGIKGAAVRAARYPDAMPRWNIEAGRARAQDRAAMAEIGRRGGLARAAKIKAKGKEYDHESGSDSSTGER